MLTPKNNGHSFVHSHSECFKDHTIDPWWIFRNPTAAMPPCQRQVAAMAPPHQLKDMMAGNSFVTRVVSTLSVSKPPAEPNQQARLHSCSCMRLLFFCVSKNLFHIITARRIPEASNWFYLPRSWIGSGRVQEELYPTIAWALAPLLRPNHTIRIRTTKFGKSWGKPHRYVYPYESGSPRWDGMGLLCGSVWVVVTICSIQDIQVWYQ